MTPYILTYFFAIIILLPVDFVKNYRKVGIFFAGAALTVLYGFRYMVGRDYGTYEIIFNNIGWLDNIGGNFSSLEPGYLLLNQLFYSLGTNFQPIVFIETVLLFFAFLGSINKYSKNTVISFVALILFMNLFSGIFTGVIRQGFAVAFFLISLRAIEKRQFLMFVLWVAIGVQFHLSILLVLPVYFVLHRQLASKYYLFLVLLAIVGYLLLRFVNIPLILIKFFGVYQGYGGEKYARFFEPMPLSSHLLIAVFAIIFCILVMYRKKLIQTLQDQLVFNLFFLSTFFSIMMLSMQLFSRVEYYFMVGPILGLSFLPRIFSSRSRAVISCAIIICCLGLALYALYDLGEVRTLIPYQSRYDVFGASEL